MVTYDEKRFRSRLKKACKNCEYTVRAINESMGGMRSGGFPAFQYDDYATGPATPTVLPRNRHCARNGCTSLASRTYECAYCRNAWYCSSECRQIDAPKHLLSWCGPKNCIVCRIPATLCCPDCLKTRNKVPTRYCNAEHQRNDWSTHMLWCRNGSATGVEPRYYRNA
ncbi:hypothetical protein C8R43DRAFT_989119 [Mycena crocata]|nr:hypothetical protein C8R43DRAFT_989119 [Mycena crocata]